MGLFDSLFSWRRKKHEVEWEPVLSTGEEVISKVVVALELNRFLYSQEYLDERVVFITNKRIIWRIWNSKTDSRTEEVSLGSIADVLAENQVMPLKGVMIQKMGGDFVTIIRRGGVGGDATHNIYLLFKVRDHAGRCRQILMDAVRLSETHQA